MATSIAPLDISRYLLQGDEPPAREKLSGAINTAIAPTTLSEDQITAMRKKHYEEVIRPQQEAEQARASEPGIVSRVYGRLGEAQTAGTAGQIEGAIGAGEAALNLGTGFVGGVSGLINAFVSMYANPPLGSGSRPDYWQNLSETTKKIQGNLTYAPRTAAGKAISEVAQVPFALLSEFSERASEAPIVRMFANEDQRNAVRMAHELVTFAAADALGRGVLSGARSKIAGFKDAYKKALDNPALAPEVLTQAQELNIAVEQVPEIKITQARAKTIRESRNASQELVQPTVPTSVAPIPEVVPEVGPGKSSMEEGLQQAADATPTTAAIIRPPLSDLSKVPEYVQSAVRNSVQQADAYGVTDEIIARASRGEIAADIAAAIQSKVPQGLSVEDTRQMVRSVRTGYGIPNMDEVRAGEGVLPISTAPTPTAATITPAVPAIPSINDGLSRIASAETELATATNRAQRARAGKKLREATADAERITMANEGTVEGTPAIVPAEIKVAPVEGAIIESRPIPGVRSPKEPIVSKAIEPSPIAEAVPEAISPTRPKQEPVYYKPANIGELSLQSRTASDAPLAVSSTFDRSPIQLRYSSHEPVAEGAVSPIGKPDAILIDSTGLNATTSLASIEQQVAKGRMSPEVAESLRRNLQRQADLFNVPIEQAHNYTGEFLITEAMRIAKEQGLEFYRAVKEKGQLRFEEVPKDVVDTALKLQDGDINNPKAINPDAAARYLQERSKPAGKATTKDIADALEKGTDISDQLPSDIAPQFKEALEKVRQGLDDSEIRGFIDVLKDIGEVIAPSDVPPEQLGAFSFLDWTPNRRAAAARLWADLKKANVDIGEFLDKSKMSDKDKAEFMRSVDALGALNPPSYMRPENMALDPEAAARGDQVLSQRKYKEKSYAPVYESERDALVNANQVRQGGLGLDVPYFFMRRAGLVEPILTAYRAVQRGLSKERGELTGILRELTRSVGSEARERIGSYGYAQDPQGRLLLERNGKEVPASLNAKEMTVYENMRELYDTMFDRINKVREAIGLDPIAREENYFTFMRTFTLAERLEKGLNLTTAPAARVHQEYMNSRSTPFPYEKLRTGATYTAEFDAFKVLQTYMQSATKQVHLAPFIAKMNELINHPLIDPATGKKTWKLWEENPGVYEYLNNWNEYLATGSNFKQSAMVEKPLRVAMNNLGFSIIAGSIKSSFSNLTAVARTYYDMGPMMTSKAIGDSFHPEKRAFAYKNSEILDTRTHEAALNDVTASIIGHSPGDFVKAIRRGRFGEVQAAVASPGLKMFELFDAEPALVAWNAGYRFATEKLGFTGKDAYIVADNTVIRTNGGSMPGDLSPVQRSVVGRAATMFQRFVINDWNFFVNDVLGMKEANRLLDQEPGKYAPMIVKNMLKFTAAMTISNIFYEDIMKMNSPNPAPERVLFKAIRENRPIPETLSSLLGTLVEPLPFINSVRYGKSFGGPVVSTIYDMAESLRGTPLSYTYNKPGDTTGERIARWAGSPAARLAGVPGAGSIGRYVRAQDRGNSPYTSLTGFYEEPQGGSSNELRSLRGSSGSRLRR